MTTLTALLACLLALGAGGARAEAVTYAIDPSHTFVNFEVSHFGTSTLRGRFDKKEGSVTLDKVAKIGKAEITIDVSSINTGVPTLDTHLKSKDFFNSTENGTATFSAEKFDVVDGKVSEVAGTLTLLGKTRAVTLKATNFNCYASPILRREVCGGDFETRIVRSAYGMNFGLDQGLPDDVRLVIQIEAIRQ